jgi:ERCC4-related helicase
MEMNMSFNKTPYHAKYFAYELTKRCPADNLEKLAISLTDAQVDLNPHQVEAALFAFHSPLSRGAILADEVGLGKTIEAGLVISQKWAERKRKILIITPANLRKQWSQELLDKFFLLSTIMETRSFNEEIKRGNLNPFIMDDIVICSYQFARSKESYLRLIDWDLVVIDEAHRLRNVYKPSNRIGRSIKASLAHAPKILLTATPLQNSLLELYGLVSIIDDYTFGDMKSFRSQYCRVNQESNETLYNELKDRLRPISIRTLRRQVLEYINFTNRIALVEEFYPTPEEQRLYELVSNYLQEPDLFALPKSQRQLMTLILRKLLASSTYAISGTLEALAGKLEEMVKRQSPVQEIEEVINDNYEGFEEIKDEWLEEEEEEEKDGNNETENRDKNNKVLSPNDLVNIKKEIKSLKEFEALAKSIQKNSKGEKLFTALEKGFEEAVKKGADKKAIIFTESRRTQDYLKNILEARGYAGKVVLFNGSNTDDKSREIYKAWFEKYNNTDRISGSKTADMRAALVEYFKNEAIIMIATEAAAEGINLQFCSLVVNYDLPWNPQRIEQRIGRCHRYGQKYDVVVVNFLNRANAADQRVYELLRDKFRLFDGVFGASDEVLGSIESGVDFEKRIAKIYQECRTLEEIQSSFDKLQAELEGNIQSALQNTRQQLLENFDAEVHEKLRINLEESKLYLDKYEHLLWNITLFYLRDDAEFKNDEYSFYLKRNPFPGEIIHPGPYRIGKNIDDVNIYRISHPLAQKIIGRCKDMSLNESRLVFDYSGNEIKIHVLEELVGKSGWLYLHYMTVSSFDSEDYLLLAGITDDGEPLEPDQAQRLFKLNACEEPLDNGISNSIKEHLIKLYSNQKDDVLQKINERNGRLFDDEIEKLDKWGEDMRDALRMTLKELDAQIKDIKKQARSAPNLPEKLKLEKEKKRLEGERDEAWKSYDFSAKEIEKNKDNLIDDTQKKLDPKINEELLFRVRWVLV